MVPIEVARELERENAELREQLAEVKEALDRVIGINCHMLHHKRSERHAADEPCPVEALIAAFLEQEKQ